MISSKRFVSLAVRKILTIIEIMVSVAIPLLLAIMFWDSSVILALVVALGWAIFVDSKVRHFIIFYRTHYQKQYADRVYPSTTFTQADPQKVPPFAVFLRGFGRERTYLREERDGGWLYLHYSNPVTGRYLEKMLSIICRPKLDLVGLANVKTEEHLPGIIQLDPGDNLWQYEIKMLFERAHAIFLYLNTWTPGLREEINLLQMKSVPRKTIILISPERKDKETEIRTALEASSNKWAAILRVPDKNISWVMIISLFMIYIVSLLLNLNNQAMVAVLCLLVIIYFAWNEFRVLWFILNLKHRFRAMIDI